MADDSVEGPIVPLSPYLRRPLRTLKEAEQDNDASGYHLMSVPDLPARGLPPRQVPAPSRKPEKAALQGAMLARKIGRIT